MENHQLSPQAQDLVNQFLDEDLPVYAITAATQAAVQQQAEAEAQERRVLLLLNILRASPDSLAQGQLDVAIVLVGYGDLGFTQGDAQQALALYVEQAPQHAPQQAQED